MKTTSNLTHILFILLISFLGFSCTSNNSATEKANDKLGKIELEIPDELKSNSEVVDYVKGLSEVADEYALLIDDMLEEYGEYSGVAPEDLTMMEQIKLTKATAEVAIRSTQIMAKWAEYQDKRNNLGTELSDAELKAIEGVWLKFEKRFEEISKKQEQMMADNSEG